MCEQPTALHQRLSSYFNMCAGKLLNIDMLSGANEQTTKFGRTGIFGTCSGICDIHKPHGLDTKHVM